MAAIKGIHVRAFQKPFEGTIRVGEQEIERILRPYRK